MSKTKITFFALIFLIPSLSGAAEYVVDCGSSRFLVKKPMFGESEVFLDYSGSWQKSSYVSIDDYYIKRSGLAYRDNGCDKLPKCNTRSVVDLGDGLDDRDTLYNRYYATNVCAREFDTGQKEFSGYELINKTECRHFNVGDMIERDFCNVEER